MKQRIKKASRPYLTDIDRDTEGRERSFNCEYRHPKGIAILSAKFDTKSKEGSSGIMFNHNSQTHVYSYPKWMTPKGLARKAFKLLNEL